MRRVEKMVKKYVFTKSQIFLSLIDLFLREWTRNIFFFSLHVHRRIWFKSAEIRFFPFLFFLVKNFHLRDFR